MIHKVIFNTRQRKTINHFRKYIITENDIEKVKKRKNFKVQKNLYVDPYREFQKLWDGFDPFEDKWDRRMLYEVTGIRLDKNEFRESDTSDEEGQALH